MLTREGRELDRSALSDWVGEPAWLLDSVTAIRQHVFAAEKIHGDDTIVLVLAPELGRTRRGWLGSISAMTGPSPATQFRRRPI